MKTFFVLFVIAVSLPAEAQRVKENVRQRVEIVEASEPVAEEAPVEVEKDKKKGKVEKAADAVRKQ